LNGTKKGFFAQNNATTPDKVFVDPDGNIATFTSSAVTNSFDSDLPSVNSVDQLDGYFLFTTGLGQIWASDLNAVTVNALSFTTDQTSGGLLRGVTWSGRYYASGTRRLASIRIKVWRRSRCQRQTLSRAALPGLIASRVMRT
jgi:hypothetical protein